MQRPSGTMTANEFLAWEREQATRHHYVRGEIFDMAGGSARHNRLSVKAASALERVVENGSCGVFSADQKIGVSEDVFVYSDTVVACPPFQFRPGAKDVLTNPALVVEVLSKSTEAYDRGDKQRGYLALPSLKHLVFVSQQSARVEVYTRQDDGSFRYEIFGEGTTVTLTHPEVSIVIDALYAGVFDLPGDE